MPSRSPVTRPGRTSGAAFGKVVPFPVPESDAALVACLRSDPERGQLVLFDRYAGDVERVLLRLLGSDPDVTDLLHDVFITAMTSIRTLRDESALRSWLVGIAVHTARHRIRRRRFLRLVRFMAPEDLPDCAATTPSQDVSDALRLTYRLLSRLSTEDRIAFTLRKIDGMSVSAIAEATGVSMATVKRRVARAERDFVAQARQHEALRVWLEQGTLEQ
jgi:RNA polymerase sigma-70 factor, ECF subfamily